MLVICLYNGSSVVFSGLFFFVKQKTAYELRISDWSSDVCSSDLPLVRPMALPSTPPMIRPIILSSPLFRGTKPRLSIRGGRFGFRPEHASRIDEPVKGRRVDRAEIDRKSVV